MIKAKHLVPGRVLAQLQEHLVWEPPSLRWKPKKFWVPCMVIACYPDIKRRHAKSSAPIAGWDVLIIWMGVGTKPIKRVRIPPDSASWKLLF